jgi:hypothetical protein
MSPLSSMPTLSRLFGRRNASPVEVEAGAPAWLAADRAAGNSWTIDDQGVTRRFFFITGCSKSGTHWVQNLLNLHPAVCVKGEFHFEHLREGFGRMVEHHYYVAARKHLRPIADLSYEAMVRRLMYAAAQDKRGAAWIGDRSPRAIEEVLPGAPIVNIRRDGRDVMVSWNFHHMRVERTEYVDQTVQGSVAAVAVEFKASPEKFYSPGTGLLADETWFRRQARVWRAAVEQELEAGPRLRERGTPVLQVKYEDLHADVRAGRRGLYAFLGLDDGPAGEISKESRTAPGFEGSTHLEFYRKGATGEWRELFTEAQKRWFKEEAGETLVRAGYEDGMGW